MKISQKNKANIFSQTWKCGNVLYDGQYFMIIHNPERQQYGLLNLSSGVLLEEYWDTIDKMRLECVNLEPCASAEIIVED